MFVNAFIQKAVGVVTQGFMLAAIIVFGMLSNLVAQDSVGIKLLKFDTVVVLDSQWLVAGQKLEELDSLTYAANRNNSLSEALAMEGHLFLKTYGQGGLTTTSWRGVGAGRTAVLWNGFNLQSPMNGVLDLSLVPMGVIDDVVLCYGGQGASHGNSAIAGVIQLDNKPWIGNGWIGEANLSGGSFGSNSQQLSLGYGGSKGGTKVRLLRNEAKNDFPLLASPDGIDRRNMPHAAFSRLGGLIEHHQYLQKEHQLHFYYWFQDTDRELPPTRFEASSAAEQQDVFHRLAVHWEHQKKWGTVQARAAWFHEVIDFTDPQSNIDAHNHSRTLIGEVETQFLIGKNMRLVTGLHERWTQAKTDNYNGEQERLRVAAFAFWGWYLPIKGLTSNVSIRQEYTRNTPIPPTPSFGLTYAPGTRWKLNGQIARTYRIPTINDLHWTPGGNPDLRSEDGWSIEAGATRHFQFGKQVEASIAITGFNINVSNLIIWLPKSGYTSPENLRAIWSRGIESQGSVHWQVSKQWKVRLQSNYQWVRSTNEKSNHVSDNSVGKQLIYVPEHQHNASLSLHWKKWVIQYRQRSTAFVYSASDNSEWLDGYSLGDMLFLASFKHRNVTWGFNAKVLNLWSVEYEALPARPMPLRNGEVGLFVKF